ncbi:hypothetical protein G5C60_18625 [Streptomyces sp. HC44]|uniref:Uncharacterized protein n=1 Tax=Streptomyces scabichelini TaxID=2711217 RepID=A0A6G4V6L1_9ACTN|nr:hypothetical protein [Streptomyces scabichelini]NGO09555.1 hypothetical protein [Streptomyces scabichelini]
MEDRRPGLGGVVQRGLGLKEKLRSVLWLRVPVTVVLLCLAGYLAVPIAHEYQDRQTYRHAPACPAGQSRTAAADADCLVHATGLITDKKAWESCSSDSYGRRCGTVYRLWAGTRVHEEQRTESIRVEEDTYEYIHRRDHAELRFWHDELVRITVRDHTERLDPYFGFREGKLLWWLMGAWFALGAAVTVATGYVRRVLSHWKGLWVPAYYFLPYAAVASTIEGVLFDAQPMWAWIMFAVVMGPPGIVMMWVFLTERD